MTEAALHWLEYLGASDQDDARLADAVKLTPRGPMISPPRARHALDQLCPEIIRIHQAGIIRAFASALDCGRSHDWRSRAAHEHTDSRFR
jgi:hypothetical protein